MAAPYTTERILAALSTVQEPELGGDLVSRKMIKNVTITGDRVGFAVELTTPACPLKHEIRTACEDAVHTLVGVPRDHIDIEFTAQVRTHGGMLDKAAIPASAMSSPFLPAKAASANRLSLSTSPRLSQPKVPASACSMPTSMARRSR